MPKAAPTFPLRDAWQPLVPLLPLVLATLLLAPLLNAGAQLAFLRVDPGAFVAQPVRNYIHLGDMLSYYALATFHTLLCLAVVITFVLWTLRLPARQRGAALILLVAVLAQIVAIGLVLKAEANRVVLVQLGYKAICQLIAAAELPTRLVVPGQCFVEGDISPLTWLAWVPTFAGIATVAFAAAFAYASTRSLPAPQAHDDAAWRAALDQRIQALQRSVYLLSAVLVSSTITITLFAHLPAGLLTDGRDLDLAGAVSKYATGLSTFWGALFSVTLVATFAAPALGLLGAAYRSEHARSGSDELRAWLQDHVFQSLNRQLATVFSLLAPLLVGPLSSLLSSVSGL
ncbi:MAG: hypothetical protein ACFB13_14985 [Kiloniellaceae bacterium]